MKKIKLISTFALIMIVMMSGMSLAKEYSAGVAYTTTNLENDNELNGYLVKLLYAAEGEGDPGDYGLPEGLYRGGWQFEKLNSTEEGIYDLDLTGAAVAVDGRIGENNLKFLISNTIGYYWGERKDETNNTREDLKGLGVTPGVGASYNIGNFELYATANYRKMFVGDYDLDGFGYKTGFIINF